MAAKYDLNDDGVVVVIGSGAGGGTLVQRAGAEGHRRGLPGGRGRASRSTSSSTTSGRTSCKISWLDKRTTSGSWRVAKDFAGLPAWIVKAVGGSTIHWAGASLRFQEHEFKVKTTYGDIAGANLLDWPLTLAELEPYYAKAEDKMGVTGTNDIPRPARQQQLQGAGGRRQARSATRNSTPATWRSTPQPRDGRGSCLQIGFCFQGCKSGAKWSTLYHGNPEGRGDRQAGGAAEFAGAADPARRQRQGDRRALCRQGRQAAGAEGARGGGRRQLDREPAAAAELGVGEVPRRARQLLGHGRQELHAAHDRLGLRDLRQAGEHVSRHHHGRHHPRRSRARSGARLRRRLRDGDAVAGTAVHGGVPRSGRLGQATSPRRSTSTRTWPACGWSARTCRRRRTASPCTRPRRTSSACRFRT